LLLSQLEGLLVFPTQPVDGPGNRGYKRHHEQQLETRAGREIARGNVSPGPVEQVDRHPESDSQREKRNGVRHWSTVILEPKTESSDQRTYRDQPERQFRFPQSPA